MSTPKVDNDTDFVAEPHLLVDKDGEKSCVIVKATFELHDRPPKAPDGSFAVAPKARRRGVRAADLPWGKPEISSIRYPSDLCLRKPGTDVIVVAIAHAPGGRAQPTFDAGVRVGKLSKVVRIHGPRVWLPDGDGVSEARPLAMLEVRYDHAFGGTDMSLEAGLLEDPRNPVGLGVAHVSSTLNMKPAPQIEDPADPIKRASDRPTPAGLGATGRHWEPRRKLWGTHDAAWLESRAPLPPHDFDDRANLAASAGLVSLVPLSGGEEGALTNLTPGGGVVAFVLPRVRLQLAFELPDREPLRVEPHLDTLLFDTIAVAPPARGARTAPSPLTLEMVWRASVPAPKKLGRVHVVVSERRA